MTDSLAVVERDADAVKELLTVADDVALALDDPELLGERLSDGLDELSEMDMVTVRDPVGTVPEPVEEPLREADSDSGRECVIVSTGVTDIVGKEFVWLSGSVVVALIVCVVVVVGERLPVLVADMEPDSVLKLAVLVSEPEELSVDVSDNVLLVRVPDEVNDSVWETENDVLLLELRVTDEEIEVETLVVTDADVERDWLGVSVNVADADWVSLRLSDIVEEPDSVIGNDEVALGVLLTVTEAELVPVEVTDPDGE